MGGQVWNFPLWPHVSSEKVPTFRAFQIVDFWLRILSLYHSPVKSLPPTNRKILTPDPTALSCAQPREIFLYLFWC
jgi:hypothetical protein